MPVVSDPMEAAYTGWRAKPNPQNASLFLQAASPTIEKALRAYAPGMGDSLKTRARIMALNAARTYDPSKGMKLNTYLFQTLHGLSRFYGRRSNPLYIPEGRLLDKGRLDAAENELKDELDREPTAAELADRTGLPVHRIESLRSATPASKSESSTFSEEGDSLFSQKSDPERLWADYVYNEMDDKDKKIFELSTGYGGAQKVPKGEIAKRLGISAPAVSQRITKISKKLSEGLEIY